MSKPKHCTECGAELWGPDEKGGLCIACQGNADTEVPLADDTLRDSEPPSFDDPWRDILP